MAATGWSAQLNRGTLDRRQMGFVEDVTEVAGLLDAWATAHGPLVTVAPPEAARVGELDPGGWGEWRMLPSRISPADVDLLESSLGVRLPPFYRAFLCCRVLLALDFGDYTLPTIGCEDPLADVLTYLRAGVGPGFMQFGSARGCGDPLCFDLRSSTPDGDCSIVVFNHDIVPGATWGDYAALQRYAGIVAPSFRSFLTSLLTGDSAIFPPPQSPEEMRRDAAWSRVQALLRQKGFASHYRPAGIDATDPWAIAEALEGAG